MPRLDAFRHAVARPDESSLHDLSDVSWEAWNDSYRAELDQHKIAASGICVMDQNVLRIPSFTRAVHSLRESSRAWFSIQPNVRDHDARTVIRAAAETGFRGITFHSYLQRIGESDFPTVVELSQYAAEQGLFVGLCTAFGSRMLYQYDSLRLAVEVLNAVNCPVVLYHGGGAKVLEAFLIAEMWEHAYLETSFSLSYWLGSSVEQDFAYAIRKLGADRIFFGSDAPFVSLDTAIVDHLEFLRRHEFSEVERDTVMGDACHRVLLGER
ncbi:MAG: amidohydrolase family protein [Fuerstiella sp.]|nr:amidohydrolase family protein [Fuerstiella sp.]